MIDLRSALNRVFRRVFRRGCGYAAAFHRARIRSAGRGRVSSAYRAPSPGPSSSRLRVGGVRVMEALPREGSALIRPVAAPLIHSRFCSSCTALRLDVSRPTRAKGRPAPACRATCLGRGKSWRSCFPPIFCKEFCADCRDDLERTPPLGALAISWRSSSSCASGGTCLGLRVPFHRQGLLARPWVHTTARRSARHRFQTADAEEPIRTDGSTVLLARGLFAPFAVRVRGSLFPHVLRMIVRADVAKLNRHLSTSLLVRSK